MKGSWLAPGTLVGILFAAALLLLLLTIYNSKGAEQTPAKTSTAELEPLLLSVAAAGIFQILKIKGQLTLSAMRAAGILLLIAGLLLAFGLWANGREILGNLGSQIVNFFNSITGGAK